VDALQPQQHAAQHVAEGRRSHGGPGLDAEELVEGAAVRVLEHQVYARGRCRGRIRVFFVFHIIILMLVISTIRSGIFRCIFRKSDFPGYMHIIAIICDDVAPAHRHPPLHAAQVQQRVAHLDGVRRRLVGGEQVDWG
jgi:hypothetical protein